jgi:hypothetical protein
MDPYLEAAELWEDVHANLATELRAQLQPQLVPRYVAVLTPYVTYEDIGIGEVSAVKPDVAVLSRPEREPTLGTPTSVVAPLTGVTSVAEPEVPAKAQRIEVRAVGGEALVTVIEILPPANKGAGTESFEAYQRKRRDLLRSPVHLLEVDLHLPQPGRPPPHGRDLAGELRCVAAASTVRPRRRFIALGPF